MQPAGVVMTDPMVADIVTTVNSGEVEQGRLALQKASSTEVRNFAQTMVNDHTAANQSLQGIMSRRNIAGADSDISRQLENNGRQTVQALNTHEGESFDRVYMDTQIAMHRWVLNSLDASLIPAARDNELENYLRQSRERVASHLATAERVRAGLR